MLTFLQYLMNSVNRRLLRLLSMVLELPNDYLWGLSALNTGLERY